MKTQNNWTFSVNSDVFLTHPWKSKDEVIHDIIWTFREESFCFLNLWKLRNKVSKLFEYFLPFNRNRCIAYAVKANPRPEIIKILIEEWIKAFDCASINEIDLIHNIEKEAKIFFNHPIKRECDIFKAASKWVCCFTIQSEEEIKKVLRNAYPCLWNEIHIMVRMQTLNPNARVNLSEKYWAELENTKHLLKILKNYKNVKSWISIHTWSQNESPDIFAKSIETIWEIIKSNWNLDIINLWWGIPVNYFEKDNFDIKWYFETINQSFNKHINWYIWENSIVILELWRAIIAEAIDLIIPVLAVEERWWRKCIYINDWIFTSFSDWVIHNWEYLFDLISHDWRKLSESKEKFLIFWRTCDSGDVVWTSQFPDNIKAWDFLKIKNAWAYMDSQTTYFNGFEWPKYIIYNN